MFIGMKPMEGTVIGNHTWMRRNLNVDAFRNGERIKEAKTQKEWDSAYDTLEPAWCYYDNAGFYGEKYGKLYNWYAISDPRGLAPEGWCIPTFEDWEMLIEWLGGSLEAEARMKAGYGWDNTNGTDDVGLSVLPGGRRGARFLNKGLQASFWCHPSEHDISFHNRTYPDLLPHHVAHKWYTTGIAIDIGGHTNQPLFNELNTVRLHTTMKIAGLSVRCVRK